jgi:hypothetical protein
MIVYFSGFKAYNHKPLLTIPSGGASLMDQSFIDRVYKGFEYERSRTAPPENFAALPPVPGGRYTDPDFLQLEQFRPVMRNAFS